MTRILDFQDFLRLTTRIWQIVWCVWSRRSAGTLVKKRPSTPWVPAHWVTRGLKKASFFVSLVLSCCVKHKLKFRAVQRSAPQSLSESNAGRTGKWRRRYPLSFTARLLRFEQVPSLLLLLLLFCDVTASSTGCTTCSWLHCNYFNALGLG